MDQTFLSNLITPEILKKVAAESLGLSLSDFNAQAIAAKLSAVTGDIVGDVLGLDSGSSEQEEGGALDVAEFDRRRGLRLVVPMLIPVAVSADTLNVILNDFDFEQELSDCLEDMNNDSIPIQLVTKDGDGDTFLIDPETVYFGGVNDDSNDFDRSNRGGDGRRARGPGRSRDNERGRGSSRAGGR